MDHCRHADLFPELPQLAREPCDGCGRRLVRGRRSFRRSLFQRENPSNGFGDTPGKSGSLSAVLVSSSYACVTWSSRWHIRQRSPPARICSTATCRKAPPITRHPFQDRPIRSDCDADTFAEDICDPQFLTTKPECCRSDCGVCRVRNHQQPHGGVK